MRQQSEDLVVDLPNLECARVLLQELCAREQFASAVKATKKLPEVEANYLLLAAFVDVRLSGLVDIAALEALAEAMLACGAGKKGADFEDALEVVENLMPNRTQYLFDKLVRGVVDFHSGKASELWAGKAPMGARRQLVEAGLGENASRRLINHLISIGAMKAVCGGKCANAKPSKAVIRVLARSLACEYEISPEAATALIKALDDELPWSVDLPLFMIGSTFCRRTGITCQPCPLAPMCRVYHVISEPLDQVP